MKLIDDWKRKWLRSWSAQLALAAGLLELANQVASILAEVVADPWISRAAAVLAILAAIARGIKQWRDDDAK